MPVNRRKQAVIDRIERYENAIRIGQEYLESGAHADWSGFRPWFVVKIKDGKVAPPHRDWVQNVFIPRREKALRKAEKLLERLELEEQKESSSRARGRV